MHAPLGTGGLEPGGRAACKDAATHALHGACQSEQIGQRLHSAAAAVEPSAAIALRSDQSAHRAAIEQLDRGAAPTPLFNAPDDWQQLSIAGCRLDPAAARRRALDSVFTD